jgi:hypothetical protein
VKTVVAQLLCGSSAEQAQKQIGAEFHVRCALFDLVSCQIETGDGAAGESRAHRVDFTDQAKPAAMNVAQT